MMRFLYFQITSNYLQVVTTIEQDHSVMVWYLRDFTTPFITVMNLLSTQQVALEIIFKQNSMVTTSLICQKK